MAQGSSDCGETTTEGCDSQGTSSTARANSGPPPSYEDSVAYHLCPEGYFDNERDPGNESHTATTSHRSRTPPPAASSRQLNIINSPWPWDSLPASSSRHPKTSFSSKHLRTSGYGESRISATLRLQDTQPPTSTSTNTLCYSESGAAATLRLTISLCLPDIQILTSCSTNTSHCGESTIAATLRFSDIQPPTSSSTNTSSSSRHLTTSPYGESGIVATLRFLDTQLPEASSRRSTISSGDFTSGPSHSIQRTTSDYQPSSVIFDKSAKSSSNSSHHQMAYSNNVPSNMVAPVGSLQSVSAMGLTTDDNAMAKNLIRQNPEIMNNIYTLVKSTINSVENGRRSFNKHNAEIESLQKQLLDSNNNAKQQTAKIEKLEADLKVATDNGLANEKTIEDLQKQLKDAQDIETNLRRGQVANTNELIPLRAQHKSLQRKFKDMQQEATSLQDRLDYQNRTLEVLSRKAREHELKAARRQDDLMALERENRELMEKGEHISGKIYAVAEQWNESGAGMGGHMAGGMGGVMVRGMQGGRGGAMRGGIGGDMGRGGSMGGHMARDGSMSRGAGMTRGGGFGDDLDGPMGGGMGGGMGDNMDEYGEGGMDGRRKRQAEEFLEDEERKRRFSRMTR